MNFSRQLVRVGVLLVLFCIASSSNGLLASGPAVLPNAAEYQLLANPGMEVFDAPYSQFEGVNCQVATGWHRFSYDGPEPCLMDTRVFAYSHLGGAWVERIEGSTSQMIVSREPYTAGIWQQVNGLTPGAGYGFHAAMLTIFQTSAGDPNDGTMIKDVGIDPTGGTNPESSTVVWSEPDGHDLGPWDTERRLSLYAEGTTATVFIRVTSPYAAGAPPFLNQSFMDSAILARTPTISAVSPAVSQSTSFVVRWDNAETAPGARALRGYEVQWKDEAGGGWHDWLTWDPTQSPNTDVTQATFTGERGHTYRFRARVWQRYTNGAYLYSPYRPDGDTGTYIKGPELEGHVFSNEGHAVSGATIAISDTAYSAVSDGNGYYRIRFLPLDGPRTITLSHPNWLTPPPVQNVTFGASETVTLDWSLRPPDDAVSNGDFESELEDWSAIIEQGVSPQVVDDPVHTGGGALALGGDAATAFTTGVTQTVTLAGSWQPALSFWYRPETVDLDDVFNVVLTVVSDTVRSAPAVQGDIGAGGVPNAPLADAVTATHVFTPSLEVGNWQHLPLTFGPEDYVTATVTIRLQVWDDGDDVPTKVYVDEVSLGRTPGGPYRSYLPLMLCGF